MRFPILYNCVEFVPAQQKHERKKYYSPRLLFVLVFGHWTMRACDSLRLGSANGNARSTRGSNSSRCCLLERICHGRPRHYVPLLGLGLWTYPLHPVYLAAALGITVYWPTVCLVAAIGARQTPGWSLDDRLFQIILPLIILWALWAFYRVDRMPTRPKV